MKRIVFLAILAVFFAALGFAQSDLQPVAIVNLTKSEPITVKQFRTEVERMEKSAGRSLTPEERRQVLDTMINERLALQAAERDKITITDNETNQQILQMGMQMFGRQATETEIAAAVGLEPAAFRTQVRNGLVNQKYLMTKKRQVFESMKVPTEEEIRERYNRNKHNLVRPESIRYAAIQVSFGNNDAAARTKAREQADRLYKDIGSNTSKFDEAIQRGKTPNQGYRAADRILLPNIEEALDKMGPEFINTAFNIKQGEVSKVIAGLDAYYIIRVTETFSQKFYDLDDDYLNFYQPEMKGTVRDYLGNAMLQERQMTTVAQATQELVAELRSGKTFQIFEKNLNW